MATDGTPMAWTNGAFEPVSFLTYDESAPEGAPDGIDLLVELSAFSQDPDRFLGRTGRLGVWIPAGSDIDPIIPHLDALSLIALEFASFADGRNYSTARLLRERYGYSGELRAVGDVLIDQIPLMRRCGIESFVVSHIPTQEALREGRIPEVRRYYQPAGGPEAPSGTRPWTRHQVEAESA